MAEPEGVTPEGVPGDPPEAAPGPGAPGGAPAGAPGDAAAHGNGVSGHAGAPDSTHAGAADGGGGGYGGAGPGAAADSGALPAPPPGDAPPPADGAAIALPPPPADGAPAEGAAPGADAPPAEPPGPRKRRHAWGPPAAGEFPTLEDLAKPKKKKKSRWESTEDESQALALIPYKGGASNALVIPGQVPKAVKLSNGMEVRARAWARAGRGEGAHAAPCAPPRGAWSCSVRRRRAGGGQLGRWRRSGVDGRQPGR
jgi:hypothetical protein